MRGAGLAVVGVRTTSQRSKTRPMRRRMVGSAARAPGYRLKVKGTAQIAFEPGRALKVVALEGQVVIALDSVMGEFESLKPGQMLIINPSDNRLPEPVEVDLQRLVATSALMSG